MKRGAVYRGCVSEDALESAIAQPLNVYFYEDGDLYEVAAAYAFHIAESQAYVDGNKRTGLIAAGRFLAVNGYKLASTNKELEHLALAVSTKEMKVKKIAAWLKKHGTRT